MIYKYYYKTDKKKEVVGTVNASSNKIAFRLAARMKRLPLTKFIKIFKIEEL